MLLPGMRFSSRLLTGGAAVMGIGLIIRRHQSRRQQAVAAPHCAPAVTAPTLPQKLLQALPAQYPSCSAAGSPGLHTRLLSMSLARSSSIVAFCLITMALGCMAAVPAVVSFSASALLATAVARLLPEMAPATTKPELRPVVDRSVLQTLTGTWNKDFKRSSSMEPFFELFKVPSIVRRAAVLMRGMAIALDDCNLHITMLCALPWFSVTETYPLSGAPGVHKRRDMRRGKQWGTLETQPDGSIRLQLRWDDPMAGSSVDEMRLADGGQELHVKCRAAVGDGRAEVHAVYRRKAAAPEKGDKSAATGKRR